MRTYKQLRKELLAAGAGEAEVKELLPIASRLSLLKISKAAVPKSRVKSKKWLRFLKPLAYVAPALALGMFIVIISQAALPTSVLYSVQKVSDSLAINLHPEYRASVMMKRAQQVNQLVAMHASQRRILAALSDYTSEASTYKSAPRPNYAAFEFCKNNLEQAAANAVSPAVRLAIDQSLRSLAT